MQQDLEEMGYMRTRENLLSIYKKVIFWYR